jgi:hypothetical protein
MALDLSKLHSVATRVVYDQQFAEELRSKGRAALAAGPGSDEMDAYFEEFAANPGDLAGMGTTGAAECTCNSNTWITLSTVVTPIPTCCAATTTTTTSGGS